MWSNPIETLRHWWQDATAGTRLASAGLALILVIGLIVAAVLSALGYQVVFHNITSTQATAIETVLRDHHIPMRYAAQDNTVSVPSANASEAFSDVDTAGILAKSADTAASDTLDKIGLMTSPEVEQRRILQSEEDGLEQVLSHLDHVKSASVTISPGDHGTMIGDDIPPAASVVLFLKPGEEFPPAEIVGVRDLVLHSVPGLTPHQITLTDQSGTPLLASLPTSPDAQTAPASSTESGYVLGLQKQLQEMADEALGQNKAQVFVHTASDFLPSPMGHSAGKRLATKLHLSVIALIDQSVPTVQFRDIRSLLSGAIGQPTPNETKAIILRSSVLVKTASNTPTIILPVTLPPTHVIAKSRHFPRVPLLGWLGLTCVVALCLVGTWITLGPRRASANSNHSADSTEFSPAPVVPILSPAPIVMQTAPPAPFQYLRAIAPAQIVSRLESEHPQTVALIFAQMPEADSSSLLAGLSSSQRADVAPRMTALDDVSPEVVRTVEMALARSMSQIKPEAADQVQFAERAA